MRGRGFCRRGFCLYPSVCTRRLKSVIFRSSAHGVVFNHLSTDRQRSSDRSWFCQSSASQLVQCTCHWRRASTADYRRHNYIPGSSLLSVRVSRSASRFFRSVYTPAASSAPCQTCHRYVLTAYTSVVNYGLPRWTLACRLVFT